MTDNQQQSVELAEAVLAGKIQADDLTDDQWALLLLAADQRSPLAPALKVAIGVLSQFHVQKGYFAAPANDEEGNSDQDGGSLVN